MGLPKIRLAVNLRQTGLTECALIKVAKILAESGFSPDRLELENH